MKIAFVTPQMIVGGAETYIIRKAQWLLDNGHTAIVISSGGSYVKMLPSGVKHFEINVKEAPYSVSYTMLNNIICSISNIIETENIDVIEAHNTWPIMYVAMSYRIHHVPYIFNVLAELSFNHNRLLCSFNRMIDKYGMYYTLTNSMNAYIEKQCKAELSPIIIPIPIDAPNIKNQNYSERGDGYFLTVGRMTSDKMYVIHAILGFKELLANNPTLDKVNLLVVGDGPLQSEVAEIAKKLNAELGGERIILKGTVIGEDLAILYNNCLAYIGVGTTLLMAASYKKPAILASGLSGYQQFAYGFWGERPDLDCDNIGANELYLNQKQAFSKIMYEVILNDNRRNVVAEKAYDLFRSIYDINSIMNVWNKSYTMQSLRKYNKRISLLGSLYYIICNVLHVAYLFVWHFKKKKI